MSYGFGCGSTFNSYNSGLNGGSYNSGFSSISIPSIPSTNHYFGCGSNFGPSGFDFEKSKRESDEFQRQQQEKERVRQAEMETYRIKCARDNERTSLQLQQSVILKLATQETEDHNARMKKTKDIEEQVCAVEELKKVAEQEAEKLKEESEIIEKKIADDLIEHERKMAELDDIHNIVICEQTQKLSELKEKTIQQEEIIERSEQGLNIILDYVETFKTLGLSNPSIE